MKKKKDSFSAVEMLFIVGLMLVAFLMGYLFCYMDTPTKTQVKVVTRTVVPQTLIDEVSSIREQMFKEGLPDNPDYRLCTWQDIGCEPGKEYIEKKWYEK